MILAVKNCRLTNITLAMLALLALAACSDAPVKSNTGVRNLAVRMIAPEDNPPEALDGNLDARAASAAKFLASVEHCQPEYLKFRPKYNVTAYYEDGSRKTYLVLGNHVKLDGASYRCPEDLEPLITEMAAART